MSVRREECDTADYVGYGEWSSNPTIAASCLLRLRGYRAEYGACLFRAALAYKMGKSRSETVCTPHPPPQLQDTDRVKLFAPHSFKKRKLFVSPLPFNMAKTSS